MSDDNNHNYIMKNDHILRGHEEYFNDEGIYIGWLRRVSVNL